MDQFRASFQFACVITPWFVMHSPHLRHLREIPYTRVNKGMRLFAKLQGDMRLIPNMCLIAKGKIDHTSKTVMPSLVAHVLDSK